MKRSSGPKIVPIKTFEPLGWQMEPMRNTSKVMLLTGSAGGGKSRMLYEKAHAFALNYPGSTVVGFRKLKEDAKSSLVLALEKGVIGDDPRVAHRPNRYLFEYSNGSVLMYRGMKGEKEQTGLRSIGIEGGIDFAFMEEAVEFDEDDYDEVLGRMRGNVAPWCQLALATNPGPPLHWINRRLIIGGEARVFYSEAKDNPYNPSGYVDTLNMMTGIKHLRLAKGLWVAGTGLVIDTWRDVYEPESGEARGGNVTLDADYIPYGGKVVLAADDGYAGEFDKKSQMFTDKSHPRVFLLMQERYDGQFACFAEIYRIKTLAGSQIDQLREMCADHGWPFPEEADIDKSAAALEGELIKAGFKKIRKGPVSRDESIKVYKNACAADVNGWRRFIVHPRCRFMRLEMNSWVLDKDGQPTKAQDNGPDAGRYFCWNHIIGSRGVDIAVASGNDIVDTSAATQRIQEVYRKHMREVSMRIGR